MNTIFDVALALGDDVNSKINGSNISYSDLSDLINKDSDGKEILSVIEKYKKRSLKMAKNYLSILALGAESLKDGGDK